VWVVDRERPGHDLAGDTRGLFESVEVVDDPRLRALAGGRFRLALCRRLVRVPVAAAAGDVPSND
jgi:hypothetical protein